jgi:hypothetical protein
MTSSLSYWQIYRGPLDEALHTARKPGTFFTVKSSSQVLRICHFGDVGQNALNLWRVEHVQQKGLQRDGSSQTPLDHPDPHQFSSGPIRSDALALHVFRKSVSEDQPGSPDR